MDTRHLPVTAFAAVARAGPGAGGRVLQFPPLQFPLIPLLLSLVAAAGPSPASAAVPWKSNLPSADECHMPLRQAPIRPAAGWRFRSEKPGKAALGWLLDPGSLTARLVTHADGDFRVRVTRVAWGRPTLAEAHELALAHGEWALVREVVLEGCGEPWVIARSVIPGRTLTGRNRRLRYLGSRPLGAFLFRDPTLQRRAVHIVRLEKASDSLKVCARITWGRRSTFILRGQPLLVAEYFLPALVGCPK